MPETEQLAVRHGREPGRWQIVHLPAIAHSSLSPGGDLLGRDDGAPLGHPDIDDDHAALDAHWAECQPTCLGQD
ncbi:hypothetical protein [Kitasatospora sp. NPDC089509]|uniref:hypothetical protein n=1 Tax=Kitasatospora sp. NPDC089509 TaxID=3364079 RepID=UPI0038237788